eukprot:153724-Ditylum_brightwellii.AAC.1
MLEYVHGSLELVEPNMIQEALLSKEQHDKEDGLWIHSTILNHCTVKNVRKEVKVLWDNGEISWELTAVL